MELWPGLWLYSVQRYRGEGGNRMSKASEVLVYTQRSKNFIVVILNKEALCKKGVMARIVY